VPLLLAARSIQGSSAAVIPLGISLLSGLLPRERAGSAIALISAMLGVGGALGLPLAGLVAEHLDFHALFWITTVAGVPLQRRPWWDAVFVLSVPGSEVALWRPCAVVRRTADL
jgi:MFS family permease